MESVCETNPIRDPMDHSTNVNHLHTTLTAVETLPPSQDNNTTINNNHGEINVRPRISSRIISTNKPAVRIRDLNVTYHQSTTIGFVLNDVQMTVPKGSIYGLLGPSGCGKTTLLKCIMGLKTCDSGDIRIFGFKAGSKESGVPGPGLGYMPQEVALSRDLTIGETWTYYGRVNFLEDGQIRSKTRELISLLDLPAENTLVAQLSGGQQRRVSFGATIFHSPRLMILDEPTVGVDPLLRTRIWQQLAGFTRIHGITVIVTTHYIEETRSADVVGFMRKGAIIAESSPSLLMENFNVNTLEGVFYRLCYVHKRQSLSFIRYENSSHHVQCPEAGIIRETYKPTITGSTSKPLKPITRWVRRFRAISAKYTLQILRQPETLMASLVLPVIVLLIFCVCIGGTPSGLAIGIINRESCEPQFHDQCLSQQFFNAVDSYVFQKIVYSDYSQAIDDVQNGKLWGAIKIEKHFTEALRARLSFMEEDLFGNPVDINASLIEIRGDLSSLVLTRQVTGSLLRVYQNIVTQAVPDNPRMADLPIRVGSTIFGSYGQVDFFGVRNFAAPGLMIVIVYSISFALTAFSLLVEKTEKTLDRNYACGMAKSHIIFGQLCTRFTFLIIPVLILLTLSITLFEIPCHGSVTAAAILLFLQTLSGMSLGVFLSAIAPSMFACCVIANAMLLFTFIISGVMWSIETLPYYLRWFSVIQPTTVAADSLRAVMVRGLPALQFNVLLGYFSSIIWIIIWLILGTFVFAFQDK